LGQLHPLALVCATTSHGSLARDPFRIDFKNGRAFRGSPLLKASKTAVAVRRF